MNDSIKPFADYPEPDDGVFAVAYDGVGNELWRSPFVTTLPTLEGIAAPREKVTDAWRIETTDGVVLKARGLPLGQVAPPTVRSGDYVIKDSGEREAVGTSGMVRDTRKGKGRYDLLPPDAMRRLAQHYEGGAEKYGPHNWEKGGPLSRYLDSLLRHAFAIVAGQTDEDHVIAVAWNAMAIADHQEKIKRGELPADLDDVFTR